jgi:hypothetical protein
VIVPRLLLLAVAGAAVLAAPAAKADVPFVERPLTLPPLHFSADAAVGAGQAPVYPDGSQSTLVAQAPVIKVGWGTSFAAAVGLPIVGEIGAREGIRFGDLGPAAGWGLGADHFARLFDPVVEEGGSSPFTNPEFRVRHTFVDLSVVEIGGEIRAVIPTSSGSSFELVPGIPLRFHLAGLARVDLGVWLPIEFNDSTSFTLDVPAELFFQIAQAFFGPATGFRYNHPGGGFDSSVDIPVGLAGGYTIAGVVDVKGELRTERINSSDWASIRDRIGGGVGIGLRLP